MYHVHVHVHVIVHVGNCTEYRRCFIVGKLANIWKPTTVGNFQAGSVVLNCKTTSKEGIAISTAMCWRTTFRSKKVKCVACVQRWLKIWLPEYFVDGFVQRAS